jgi:hypothetical protein
MGLEKSARNIRHSAEREAKAGKQGGDRDAARREADTAAAEELPEIVKHEHSKAKPPRR